MLQGHLKFIVKMFVLFVLIFLIVSFLVGRAGASRGAPGAEILSTEITFIHDDGEPRVQVDVEVRNNRGRGFVVVEVRALSGFDIWEKRIDLYMRSGQTLTPQFIFEDRNIARRNPHFSFYVSNFN
ncbi:MAG: hypothetical protein FWC36_09320 [Spirochaetes bacterium]|nr:hypothetical protein [Spirochaetota bacterium]